LAVIIDFVILSDVNLDILLLYGNGFFLIGQQWLCFHR